MSNQTAQPTNKRTIIFKPSIKQSQATTNTNTIKTCSLHLQTNTTILSDLEQGEKGRLFSFVQAVQDKPLDLDTFSEILHLKMHNIIYSTFGSQFYIVDKVDFKYIRDYIINIKSEIHKDKFDEYINTKLTRSNDELQKIEYLHSVIAMQGYSMTDKEIMNWLIKDIDNYLNNLDELKRVVGDFNLGDYTIEQDGKYQANVEAMKTDLQSEDSLIKKRLEYIVDDLKAVMPTITYHKFVGKIDLNNEYDYDLERVWDMLVEFQDLK